MSSFPPTIASGGVAKAVESLQKQTIDENALEIILVNNGSTDSTAAICHELAGKASNIVVIDKENGGVGSAAMRESKPPGASTSPSWIATIRCFPKP